MSQMTGKWPDEMINEEASQNPNKYVFQDESSSSKIGNVRLQGLINNFPSNSNASVYEGTNQEEQ